MLAQGIFHKLQEIKFAQPSRDGHGADEQKHETSAQLSMRRVWEDDGAFLRLVPRESAPPARDLAPRVAARAEDPAVRALRVSLAGVPFLPRGERGHARLEHERKTERESKRKRKQTQGDGKPSDGKGENGKGEVRGGGKSSHVW